MKPVNPNFLVVLFKLIEVLNKEKEQPTYLEPSAFYQGDGYILHELMYGKKFFEPISRKRYIHEYVFQSAEIYEQLFMLLRDTGFGHLHCEFRLSRDQMQYFNGAEMQKLQEQFPELKEQLRILRRGNSVVSAIEKAGALFVACARARSNAILQTESDILERFEPSFSEDEKEKRFLKAFRFQPIEFDFSSESVAVAAACRTWLDRYLQAFMTDDIEWQENVLKWTRQRDEMRKILTNMKEAYGSFRLSFEQIKSFNPPQGFKLVESLLSLHKFGEIPSLSLWSDFADPKKDFVDYQNFGIEFFVSFTDAQQMQKKKESVRYLNIITDFDAEIMYREDNKRIKSGFHKDSAIYYLWQRLRENVGEPQDRAELKKYIDAQTKRKDEMVGSALQKCLANLQRKLIKVSGKKPKTVAGWFEKTQTTICLKKLD